MFEDDEDATPVRVSTARSKTVDVDQTEAHAKVVSSFDCLTEHELLTLAGVSAATAESWRKRGKGPAYALIGNRFLYPRQAVDKWIRAALKQRREPLTRL